MKKLTSLLLVLALVLTLVGCQAKTPGGAGKGVAKAASAVYPEAIQYDDYDAKWENWEANEVDKAFLDAVNRFGWATASKLLAEQTESVACSPLSLYYALALTAEGSNGTTGEQFYDLLGANRDTVREQCGKLFRYLYTDQENTALTIANSIWMDNEVQGIPITFSEDYKKNAIENYYSSLFTADFASDATGKAIGQWISEATRDKLTYEPEASDDTMMAIINTIYLKAGWQDEFNKDSTSPDTFYPADNTEEQADFMHRTTSDFFYRGEGYTAAALPLRGDGVGEVIFVLPDEGMTVDHILMGDDPFAAYAAARDNYQDWEKTWWEIAWSVPKFEYHSTLNIVETMKALGVTDAFDIEAANFSGLSDAPAVLSKVIQGTHIGMNEKGVEAAAYTVVEALAGSAAPRELEQVEMNLNRPFLYSITGNNGAVLFVGIYHGNS